MSVAEARRLIRDAAASRDEFALLLIDPRPESQFLEGHIPGARNLLISQVRESRPDPMIARYEALLVYGNDPGSAVAVGMAKRLISAKYDGVRLLDGGLLAWRAQGGELEPPPPPAPAPSTPSSADAAAPPAAPIGK